MQMKLFCLVTALALNACTPTATAPVADNGISFGQKAVIDGPVIMPVELLEDSRCPADAQCVWPGQVRITAKWLRPSGDELIELTNGHPVPLADGTLTLIGVTPIRTTKDKIPRNAYRFTFSFAGGL